MLSRILQFNWNHRYTKGKAGLWRQGIPFKEFKSGFFNSSTINILDQIILCCQGCPMHYRTFINMSPDFVMCLLWRRLFLDENLCVTQEILFFHPHLPVIHQWALYYLALAYLGFYFLPWALPLDIPSSTTKPPSSLV